MRVGLRANLEVRLLRFADGVEARRHPATQMHKLRRPEEVLMARPTDFVSRLKALMFAGMNAKSVSVISGVPVSTLRRWRAGEVYGYVDPDPAVREMLKKVAGVSR